MKGEKVMDLKARLENLSQQIKKVRIQEGHICKWPEKIREEALCLAKLLDVQSVGERVGLAYSLLCSWQRQQSK